MMIKNILSITAMLAAITASAQNDSLMNQGRYDYELSKSAWQGSNNAASLSLQNHINFGKAYFNYSHKGGDFYRVQEGDMNNRLQFFTESWQKLGKYLYAYGKFDFNTGRTKNRSWTDVMRPYNSNPYFSGSGIKASYEEQNINLTAAIGSIELMNGWRFGAKLDYNLGDLSRLRDPRSRSQLLNYKLTPAITYSTGNNIIGIAGWYNRRKEKISNVTTVDNTTKKIYYLMYGLENAVGSMGGSSGYQREWVNHEFGAELSYGYNNYNYNNMTAVSIARGSEGVYGQYKYQPGHYYTYNYAFKSQHRYRSSETTLHQLDLYGNYTEGYANEYRQQLVVTTDPSTGYNSYRYDNQLTYNKRYQVKLFDANFHYRFNKVANKEIPMFVGILASLKQVNNKYLLNTSTLKYSNFDITVENGWNFSNIGFSTTIQLGYNNSTKSTLELADPTTDYAQSVLIPDMDILGASYAHGYLELMYQRPISIKGMRSNWFIKGYGNLAISNKKINDEKLKRYNVGLSIGVFY